jgi:SAM-dependent methyltransferase
MSISENVERYRKGLLTSEKYLPEQQLHLKQRVFETFDMLLRHRGLRGLERGVTLLDLGSADGAFVAVCKKRGLQATGLDISDGVNFEVDSLPMADNSVDIVTAISLIEHLYSPAKLLNEAMRVLRPGGAIILVSPNWYYSASTFFDDPTHVHPYTQKSLAAALRNFQFEGVYVVPWLVKKPASLWDLPKTFFIARWLIPFRGNAPAWVPSFLKGKSASLLALAVKPNSENHKV